MPDPVRLWWELARRGFRRHATYRWATAAGVFTNTFFGYLRAYILLAVHRERPRIGAFDPRQAVTFAFLTQALIVITSLWGWTELADRIRSGDVATDLYRPVDLQAYYLATDLGRAAFHTVFRGLPPVLLGAVVFRLALPGPGLAGPIALSVLLAAVVGFGIAFLLNLVTFWLLDAQGAINATTAVAILCSGLAVPLVYFPSPLAGIVRALPWASMIELPAEVMLGQHHGAGLAGVLLTQAGWAAALLVAGHLLLRAATRKVIVQGG